MVRMYGQSLESSFLWRGVLVAQTVYMRQNCAYENESWRESCYVPCSLCNCSSVAAVGACRDDIFISRLILPAYPDICSHLRLPSSQTVPKSLDYLRDDTRLTFGSSQLAVRCWKLHPTLTHPGPAPSSSSTELRRVHNTFLSTH